MAKDQSQQPKAETRRARGRKPPARLQSARSQQPGVRSPQSEVQSPKPASAYVAALTMLSRRELSEAQVRQRLARRDYTSDEIADAVARLTAERAIDDERVAGAIARSETATKKRGRRRVAQQMARAGIRGTAAKRALDETYADLDEDTLIESALARRLRNGRTIADDREFARLYRYLIGQGFEHDRVMSLLSKRRYGPPEV